MRKMRNRLKKKELAAKQRKAQNKLQMRLAQEKKQAKKGILDDNSR